MKFKRLYSHLFLFIVTIFICGLLSGFQIYQVQASASSEVLLLGEPEVAECLRCHGQSESFLSTSTWVRVLNENFDC